MNSRPRLKSHVQPLRRGPGSLQLGLCPDAGVVLDGLSDAEIAVLEGLDGSLDIQTLYAVAAAAGVAAGWLSAVIATLDEHHLLIDTATDRALRLSPICSKFETISGCKCGERAHEATLPRDPRTCGFGRQSRRVQVRRWTLTA